MSADFTESQSGTASIVHNILIVDDDAEFRQSLRDILTDCGFHVLTAKDGGQAHSSFTMNKPDFVILDLILPGESGFEVCERMKLLDETIPVVVLSVIDMEDSRDLAQRVGADDYLVKPCDAETLVVRIHEIAEANWQKMHGASFEGDDRIRFKCKCGKRFRVSPVHRGRTMTCPDCGEPLVVPRHS